MRVIEELDMLQVDGYKMFQGSIRIKPVDADSGLISKDIVGTWLYRPDTDRWYCDGKSYPAAICRVTWAYGL